MENIIKSYFKQYIDKRPIFFYFTSSIYEFKKKHSKLVLEKVYLYEKKYFDINDTVR